VEEQILNSTVGDPMPDLLYIGLTIALFGATVGLVRFFEMLMESSK